MFVERQYEGDKLSYNKTNILITSQKDNKRSSEPWTGRQKMSMKKKLHFTN